MRLPRIACLCPTAFRPWCLENAIACFLKQDYPADRRRLIVLDDTGAIKPQQGDGWEIFQEPHFPTLPEKYNRLLAIAEDADLIAVWEDDDIYLPWHLSAAVTAMQHKMAFWAKPSKVWSLYTGRMEQEDATGRMHASLVVSRPTLIHSLGGWPRTRRADFDLQLIAGLQYALGPAAAPCTIRNPGYVFRWGSTQAYHGQAYGRGPDDPDWYERAHAAGRTAYGERPVVERIDPRFDSETERIWSQRDHFSGSGRTPSS